MKAAGANKQQREARTDRYVSPTLLLASPNRPVRSAERRSKQICTVYHRPALTAPPRIRSERRQPGCNLSRHQRHLSLPSTPAVSNPPYPVATNGVVLATEKKSSNALTNSSSLEKIAYITPNIGMVYSGMGPDFRVLVDKARKVSHTNYKRIYNEYPPTRILVQDVAKVMQEATQSGGVRPYGVSLLVAGWDDKPAGTGKGGPALYQVCRRSFDGIMYARLIGPCF